jgi:hypothetical protein
MGVGMKRTIICLFLIVAAVRLFCACSGHRKFDANTLVSGHFSIVVPQSATIDDRKRIGLMAVSKPILCEHFVHDSLPKDVLADLVTLVGDSVFEEIHKWRLYLLDSIWTNTDSAVNHYIQTNNKIFTLFDNNLTPNEAVNLVERCHIANLQAYYKSGKNYEYVFINCPYMLGEFIVDLKAGRYFIPRL